MVAKPQMDKNFSQMTYNMVGKLLAAVLFDYECKFPRIIYNKTKLNGTLISN